MSCCRWFILPSIVVVTFAFASYSAEDKPAAPAPGTILQADGPIKIDGVLDEPAWEKATPVEVNYAWGRVNSRSEEPRMKARFTWDGDYLYIGYETFDKNLVALGTSEQQGPKDNQREGAVIGHSTEKVDVVEFFISFGDHHYFWEVHHNAANQFNDIWCSVVDDTPLAKTTLARFGIHFGTGQNVEDDTPAGVKLASAVRLKPKADGKPSTLNDAGDTDTGYVGEIRLPWAGLGAPLTAESYVTVEPKESGGAKSRHHGPWKMAGQEIMLLSVFQDGDLKDHYHHASPTFPGSWFHKGTAHWPHYRLEAK